MKKTNFGMKLVRLLLAGLLLSGTHAAWSQHPNILLIMTDQQAWDAVGYAGNDQVITPNLLGANPRRFEYQEQAEQLRSMLVDYLEDVNYPLVAEIESRQLVRPE